VRFYFLNANAILALLLVTAVGCSSSDTSDSWSEALSGQLHKDTSMIKIDTGFCNFMRKYHVPEISVAIAKDDRLVYLKSFGLANLSDGIEADTHSLFRIVELDNCSRPGTVRSHGFLPMSHCNQRLETFRTFQNLTISFSAG